MQSQEETFNALVMSQLSRFSPAAMLKLYHTAGSATEVMHHRRDIRDLVPEASDRLAELMANSDDAMRRAEDELKYVEEYGLKVLTFDSPDYPQRLRECEDAPIALFYNGNADLNAKRVVCVIGTRHATQYGKTLVERFCQDLRYMSPGTLVVSGLAYGIDITAHRNAMSNGLSTVAVLAHGLDDLYPSAHRATASQMLSNGGLLTEYYTHTRPDKFNFVQRNRIVAGMSDACVVVESAKKGGSLITARLSQTYYRDVFAYPGAVGMTQSEGCNDLIRNSGAQLIASAEDFLTAMGWTDDNILAKARQQGIERSIFPELTSDEKIVVNVLSKQNDLPISMLTAQTGMTVAQLASLLFEMEMKGVVKSLAGGLYHII